MAVSAQSLNEAKNHVVLLNVEITRLKTAIRRAVDPAVKQNLESRLARARRLIIGAKKLVEQERAALAKRGH